MAARFQRASFRLPTVRQGALRPRPVQPAACRPSRRARPNRAVRRRGPCLVVGCAARCGGLARLVARARQEGRIRDRPGLRCRGALRRSILAAADPDLLVHPWGTLLNMANHTPLSPELTATSGSPQRRGYRSLAIPIRTAVRAGCPCAREPAHHGAQRNVEPRGNVAIRIFLEVIQQ